MGMKPIFSRAMEAPRASIVDDRRRATTRRSCAGDTIAFVATRAPATSLIAVDAVIRVGLRRAATGQGGCAMRLPKGYHALKHLPDEKVTDQITRRVLSGEKEMIVWWSMKAGAHAAAHRHPHEQIFWVISGRMDFRLGDDKRTCVAGDVGVIPGGVEHEAWFPENTEVVDVFSPPSEDFLRGEVPAYMRKG